MNVIPRSEWGARYADGGGSAPVPFSEWWLHHSVTIAPDLLPPYDDEYRAMRVLEDIGQKRFGQGISYTWPVMPTGRVYQGHSVDRLGAHTGGRNSIARAICLVGNYDATRPTGAQVEASAQLMVREYRAGRANRYTLNGGHQQLKATTCPGKYGMAAIAAINARAAAIMEDDLTPEQDRLLRETHGVLFAGTTATPRNVTVYGRLVDVQTALTNALPVLLADAQKPGADSAAIATAVVEAIPKDIAQAVIDGLGRKLAPPAA